MSGILVRERTPREDRHTEEDDHMRPGRNWSDVATGQGMLGPPEAVSNKEGPNPLCQHRDLGGLAFRMVREYISVSYITQFVVLCYGTARKLINPFCPSLT